MDAKRLADLIEGIETPTPSEQPHEQQPANNDCPINSEIPVVGAIENDCPVLASEGDTPNFLQSFASKIRLSGQTSATCMLWRLETLYKRNVQGTVRAWRIGCECVVTASEPSVFLYTEYGLVGENRKVTIERSEVRCNRSGRGLEEQAWIQARQKWREMWRDDGYRFYKHVLAREELPMHDQTESRPLPAKATLWKRGDIDSAIYPVAAQAKLDGHRMLARLARGDQVICRTCNNREHSHLSDIKSALAKLFMFLPSGAEIDGEIFTPELTFQQLSSAIRNERKQTPEQRLLKFYMFDLLLVDGVVEGGGVGASSSSSHSSSSCGTQATTSDRAIGIPFEFRYNMLLRAFIACQRAYPDEKLVLVLSSLLRNDDEVDRSMDMYVQGKYEGVILRKVWLGRSEELRMASLYHTDRSRNMYKHKPFRDEEGRVVGVSDASGREAGAALLQVLTPEGKSFTLRMVGSLERRREWLQTPSLVVGKLVTYRFQDKTDSGLPRFPRGIEIRDYE